MSNFILSQTNPLKLVLKRIIQDTLKRTHFKVKNQYHHTNSSDLV